MAGSASDALESWHLDGKLVEIHDVSQEVDVRDRALNLLGETVDPNGRHGVARWDDLTGDYFVETLDGLVLSIPQGNLRETVLTGPGLSDATWPTISMSRAGPSFAFKVAEVLRDQAYCFIDMPPLVEHHRFLNMSSTLCVLHESFEELYLGPQPNARVVWMEEADPPFDLEGEFVSRWYQPMQQLSYLLLPLTESVLGFRASAHHVGTLFRKPVANSREQVAVSLAGEDTSVEQQLDFARRRRLCFMYFVNSHDTVEFRWKAHPSNDAVRVSTRSDQLLVFRHDLLSYRYEPVSGTDMVLQTWMLEEPPQLEVQSYEGTQETLLALMGGPKLSSDRQVHVMNGICRFPASAYRLERDWAAYVKQSDGFLEIPIVRFDIDVYYESGDQFNASGKSSTKHSGLLADLEMIMFDNECFEMEPEHAQKIPCIQRVMLELALELFNLVGFSRQTIAGKPIYAAIADIGLEWDAFMGMQDHTSWLKSSPLQLLSVNRLCHTFGLTGPAHQVDTACSASLVASNMAHAYLRKHDNKGVKMSLAMGLQHILFPWPFIGLSGAGMLGRGGRCLTFDQSANGYNRGEGCGGLFCKVSDELSAVQERLAAYLGSYVNQDGRSASLTAPNGPSQQMVVRGSLSQAEIGPDWVSATENHGTGTALGDPIETGTIRAVFRRRDVPLPVTSGKTHMGHLEAGAGAVGILKTICSVVHSAVPPNCHLRQPNAHCEFDGFPGVFPTEVLELPTEYHYAGCNGFGFGGTNSRADFFGHRRDNIHTPRQRELLGSKAVGEHRPVQPLVPKTSKLDWITVPCASCSGPMCWLCSVAPPERASGVKHRCVDVRAEAASYDGCSRCYEGEYLRGGPEKPILEASAGYKVFLSGTWSAWTALDEMRQLPDRGAASVYEGEVMLGDTRLEQFHVVVTRGPVKGFIQPSCKRAGQRARVMAPAPKEQPGKHWLIDGFCDGVRQGALYRIRLEWGDQELAVTWAPAGTASEDWAPASGRRFVHRYFLASSVGGWVPTIGTNDKDDRYLWRWFLGRIPYSGRVELMFVRDQDQSQVIYPVSPLPTDESVAVVGPDDGGAGKRWVLLGKEAEPFFVFLRVCDGSLSVSLKTETTGKLTWFGTTDRAYHVIGSWDRWEVAEMRRVEGASQLWRHLFRIGETGREEFHILVNQNLNLRIYPAGGGSPGQDLACGPDRKGNQKYWQVLAPPGCVMEIVLDLGAEDQRRVVTCRPLDERGAPLSLA